MTTTAHPAPTGSAVERQRLQRRTTRVLLASQIVAGAGLAAGVTVGALLAEDMLGSTRFSGVPVALFTLGSAGTAYGVGVLSDRSGRRVGLGAGYLAATLGGLGVTVAAVIDSVGLLLVAMVMYGAGTATNLQARYAGGDLVPPARRATAISTVLLGTTVGAVAGPNLVAPAGELVQHFGIPPLAGPFAMAAVAYAAAGLVVTVWLRPDPLLAARVLDRDDAAAGGPTLVGPARTDRDAVRLGATTMVVTQLVMVAVMTMTPIHMRGHGHGLAATGIVIAVHIGGMYLPSPVSGRLVDRYGSRPVTGAAGVALLAAGTVAASAPPASVPLLALALALLGLGWNLGLLAGTALVANAVSLEKRARIQGRVDVAVAVAGAAGGLSSGVLMAATSYPALALSAGGVAAFVLAAGLRAQGKRSAGVGRR